MSFGRLLFTLQLDFHCFPICSAFIFIFHILFGQSTRFAVVKHLTFCSIRRLTFRLYHARVYFYFSLFIYFFSLDFLLSWHQIQNENADRRCTDESGFCIIITYWCKDHLYNYAHYVE